MNALFYGSGLQKPHFSLKSNQVIFCRPVLFPKGCRGEFLPCFFSFSRPPIIFCFWTSFSIIKANNIGPILFSFESPVLSLLFPYSMHRKLIIILSHLSRSADYRNLISFATSVPFAI